MGVGGEGGSIVVWSAPRTMARSDNPIFKSPKSLYPGEFLSVQGGGGAGGETSVHDAHFARQGAAHRAQKISPKCAKRVKSTPLSRDLLSSPLSPASFYRLVAGLRFRLQRRRSD